jgi:hypothetical protein
LAAGAAALAQNKSLPNQAGNAKLSLRGTAITDRKEIAALLGVDLGPDWIVVKLWAGPETPNPLRLSIDDFTLISRKNGERSGAFAPSAIAGAAAMIVRPGPAQGGQQIGGPVSQMPPGLPVPPLGGGPLPRASAGGIGNSGTIEGGEADIQMQRRRQEDPRLAALEAKAFPEIETKEPVEGLLYFNLSGKLKPKDLGLLYAGPAGRLAMDFK